MTEQPTGRVVALVDMDAFYSQVEVQRDLARLDGKPVGVVQYNPYGDLKSLTPDDDRLLNSSNGSLIAVNYVARGAGVKRNMRGDEARKACPELQLVQVPTAHGKADLTLYREAGARVVDILARKATCERASIDECYLDLTSSAQQLLAETGGVPPLPINSDQVHVAGAGEGGLQQQQGSLEWWQRPQGKGWGEGERLLACGAAVVAELRQAVFDELGYTCSAGIAHTKLLAKLAAGLHKPAQQTVVPAAAVPALLAPLPISKLRQLGGKFGERVAADLEISTVGELAAVPLQTLQQLYGDKDGTWLHSLAWGVDDGAVEERRLSKSLSCGKTFRGNHALRDMEAVAKWLGELAGELEERLAADQQAHRRVAQLLTVTFSQQLPWAPGGQQGAGGSRPQGTPYTSTSRSCPLRRVQAAAMTEDAAALVRRWVQGQGPGWSIGSMFLAASNFQPAAAPAAAITRFFKPAAPAAAAGQPAGSSGCRSGGAAELAGSSGGTSAAGSAAAVALGEVRQAAGAPGPQQQHQQYHHQQQRWEGGGLWGSPAGRAGSTWGPGTDLGGGGYEPPGVSPPRQPSPGASGAAHNSSRPATSPGPGPPASSPLSGVAACSTSGGAAAVDLLPGRQPPAGSTGEGAGTDLQAGAGEQDLGIDLEVLSELPASIQREVRAQLKAQQMTAHLRQPAQKKQRGGGSGGGGTGSSGSKRQKTGGGSGGRGISSFFAGK